MFVFINEISKIQHKLLLKDEAENLIKIEYFVLKSVRNAVLINN